MMTVGDFIEVSVNGGQYVMPYPDGWLADDSLDVTPATFAGLPVGFTDG